MGRIVAGDLYIKARKLHRISSFVYSETDELFLFYMNAEGVRIPDMSYMTMELCRTTRVALPQDAHYKLEEEQVELLKRRVRMEPGE